MKRLAFLAALLCLFIFGCGTHANRLNSVSVGMAKEDVIKGLGNPLNITADGASEVMNYRLVEDAWEGTTYPYVVVLQGGKVVSYGRMGTDSSARPVQYQTIFVPAK